MVLGSPLLAPQLLAFPYKVETRLGTVWSDQALDRAMLEKAVARAADRLAASPLAEPDERRWIFVTDGGWRWLYVANVASDAFAITRPFSPAVTINRTDPASGTVRNGFEVGGQRTLAGVLAHEITHGMIRRRYGILAERGLPPWKVEGYCDHVAGESSLDDDEAAALVASGGYHPALVYLEGRRRVEAILRANGGSVDALFLSE